MAMTFNMYRLLVLLLLITVIGLSHCRPQEGPEARESEDYNIAGYDDTEDRSRAHSVMLAQPPPISSLLDKIGERKKKPTKPQKPNKEEESEEVGEEVDSGSNENTSDGVAISPPPEGASVAEARPVGLAIAGPGGVAAAKPQGTAVVGRGGLAIARPVGTAIAGVDVEGSIPIGGKKPGGNKVQKPAEDENDDTSDLKYVGGLTGPIGNPKPKEIVKDLQYVGGLRGTVGNSEPRNERLTSKKTKQNPQDVYNVQNLPNTAYLGFHNGKYGLVPSMQRSSWNRNVDEPQQTQQLQKRVDNNPEDNNQGIFFHGLLGQKNAQGRHAGLQQQLFYPVVYY